MGAAAPWAAAAAPLTPPSLRSRRDVSPARFASPSRAKCSTGNMPTRCSPNGTLELMIAASLEALTRPGEQQSASAALGRSDRRNVAGSLSRLPPTRSPTIPTCWSISSKPRRSTNWIRRASDRAPPAAPKADGSKTCAPFPGSSAGCRAATPSRHGSESAMLSKQFAKSGPGHEQLLRQIARGFPVFSELLRNVELGMAKADLGIARDYSGLVENAALRKRVFSMLEEEFVRSRRMILRVTGQRELLARNRVLARSIRLRNPYVDPMSLIQVELLRRKAAGTAKLGPRVSAGRNHQRHRRRPAQHRLGAIAECCFQIAGLRPTSPIFSLKSHP